MGASTATGTAAGSAGGVGLDSKSSEGVNSGVSAPFLAAVFFVGFFVATLAINKNISNQLESNYLPDMNGRHALDGARPD